MADNKERTLLSTEPRMFWKEALMGISKYLFVILLISFLFSVIEESISLARMLPFVLLILLVPIYQIIVQRRDDIYFLNITEKGQIVIKWKKWFIDNELTISISQINVLMKPSLKSCYLLRFTITGKESGITINQLCSPVWTSKLMQEVVTFITDFDAD